MSDTKGLVCIKIGGRAAADESAMRAFIGEAAALMPGMQFVVVHGGGAEVTRVSKALGYAPSFRDGVRMTSPEEMAVVDMVLSGMVNKTIVRRFNATGVGAVGVSGSDGSLFVGQRLAEDTHTGRVERVDTRLVETLLAGGYVPILASTSMTAEGIPLNINADEAAFSVAAALPADTLLFLSDIPGILDQDGDLISELTPDRVASLIEDGTVTGGMIPKVRASVHALEAGVGSVVIGQYNASGDLERLLTGPAGSRIRHSRERR